MTFKRREFACYCEMYFKCKRIPKKLRAGIGRNAVFLMKKQEILQKVDNLCI